MIFIAEIGLNHNGNFNSCYEMIKLAKKSGADIAKFQLGWKSLPNEINFLDLERIKTLKKGSPSPSFNYPDSSGKNISLESLKGKLVYVDVWATWCGPCKAQIPFLKQLEEKYREEDIAFVSLSIDQLKNISKWKDMIVDKELEGIQIIADKAWRSKFVTDYVIEGIPRFILIDKDGNLMDPMAPRPAVYKEGEMQLNEEIQKIFDENI